MIRLLLAAVTALWAVAAGGALHAHALEPGYLDLQETAQNSWRVFWRRPDVQGAPMPIQARLPDSCTPSQGPGPGFDGAAWSEGWIAVCPDGLPGRTIVIKGLERTRTDVLVRVQPLDGVATTERLTPEEISYTVPVDPSTAAVFTSYFQLGMVHILEGIDHLLFVFALLLLIRSPGRLVGAVTAFTLAHSITLALATLDVVNVPGPPVEAVIALSIVFVAVEILKSGKGSERLSERFPWIVSFSFGLLHGLGFAGALSEIGLPQGDIPAALLAFNIGVEAGQLLFIAVVASAFWLLRRLSSDGRGWLLLAQARTAPPALAYGVGLVATYWVAERIAGF